MNKKQKTSIIFTSLGALTLAGFVAAGATYALFTSESKTNIAVTSGKVNVTATIDNIQTYSGVNLTGDAASDNIVSTEEPGVFSTGGTASFATENENKLTLSNMVPGDKVTFDVVITNYSNVAAKYRNVVAKGEDTGLFSGLEIKIDGKDFVGTKIFSEYADLGTEGNVITIPVEVNLPSDRDDSYQNTKTELYFNVEAVQGNVFDGVYHVSTETAQETLDSLKGDAIVELDEGNYSTLYLRQNLSSSARRSDLDCNISYPAYYRSLQNITIKAKENANVTIDGIKVEAGLFWEDSSPASNHSEMGRGFISYIDLENLTIDGLKFNQSTENSVFLKENNGQSRGANLYVNNLVIKNCEATGNHTANIHFFNAGSGSSSEEFLSTGKKGLNNIYIVNNKLTSFKQAITMNNNVALLNGLIVKNNTFTDCDDNNIQLSNKSNEGEFIFDNNTLVNMNGRFLRLANTSDSLLVRVRNTKVVTPTNYDSDGTIVKVSGTAGFSVLSTNNHWGEGSYNTEKTTWSVLGDTTLLS